MSIITFPLDVTDYTADALGAWFAARTRGVFAGEGHYCITTNDDMTITVGPGLAWLRMTEYWGVVAFHREPTTLTVSLAENTLQRVDAVCLQLDKVANTSRLLIRRGEPGVDTPPPPVRDSGMDEIYLATIKVPAGAASIQAVNIADQRLNEDYCGLMSDGTKIPTQQLHDAWTAWFADMQKSAEKEIGTLPRSSELGGSIPLQGTSGEHIVTTVDQETGTISAQLTDDFLDTIDFFMANLGKSAPAAGTIGDLPIGSVVHTYVNGQFRAFLVWRHGAPSSDYTGYDNATFLLQQRMFDFRQWNATPSSDYAASEVHAWLNSDYKAMFQGWLQDKLIIGRIPYRPGNDGSTVLKGTEGLETAVFLPSSLEVGISNPGNNVVAFGDNFGLFPDNASRIASNGIGTVVQWWLRTPNINGLNAAAISNVGGQAPASSVTATGIGMRPVIALPQTTSYDSNMILIHSK